MSYCLEFHLKALKEWTNLNKSVKEQFAKKLKQRLDHPRVEKDKLSGHANVYKIKLRSVGYRLAYEVIAERLVVYVVAVGKRENNKVYNELMSRI